LRRAVCAFISRDGQAVRTHLVQDGVGGGRLITLPNVGIREVDITVVHHCLATDVLVANTRVRFSHYRSGLHKRTTVFILANNHRLNGLGLVLDQHDPVASLRHVQVIDDHVVFRVVDDVDLTVAAERPDLAVGGVQDAAGQLDRAASHLDVGHLNGAGLAVGPLDVVDREMLACGRGLRQQEAAGGAGLPQLAVDLLLRRGAQGQGVLVVAALQRAVDVEVFGIDDDAVGVHARCAGRRREDRSLLFFRGPLDPGGDPGVDTGAVSAGGHGGPGGVGLAADLLLRNRADVKRSARL
jgi:hypothetical protein